MPDYSSPYKIPGINLKFNNDPLKLRQPKNLHINLKQDEGPWSPGQGLVDFAGGLTAVTGGLSLLGDINNINKRQKQQRSFFQDVFNTTNVTPEEKMGTWKWLNSTGQFTDYPNQKTIPYETGASNGVNANTIMYPGNNMSKRKYGGSLFLTMAEGGQTPAPQPGMSPDALPKLQLGSMSPVQKMLAADNQHYGIPLAKKGGFFTPDKLSAGAENDEFYNKPQDDLMVAKKIAQDYIYKKGVTGESIPDINAPKLAMGGNPFDSFGSANDTFRGSSEQFGQYNNPLTQYYAGLYNPEEHDALAKEFPSTMTNMYRSIVSPITANVRAKDQALMEQLQNLDNLEQQKYGGMKRYQTTGAVTPPTATDAAGFENWYNTTMGNLLSKGAKPEEINAFINQAKQWAYDAKIDPNQLGQTNLNTNTVQGSMDAGYEADLDKTIADFENKYATAAANGASQADLDKILAEQDAAVKGIIGGQSIDASGNMTGGWSGKYNPKVTNVPADYFGIPGAAPGTTPGTTPSADGQGRGGYGYSPYVTDVLQAMANGYTRVPLLGFRSRRGLNNVLREAMAQRMLGEAGQGNWQAGNGTLNSAGAEGGWQGGVNMNPGVIPGGGSFDSESTYNTWMEDNNIKRYRSDANPMTGRYRLDVKRYNPNGISFGGRGDDSEGLIERLRERRRDRKEFGDMTPMEGKDISPLPYTAPGTPDILLPNNRGFLEGRQQEIDYRNTPNAYSPLMPRDAQPSGMIYPPMMPGEDAPESLIGNPYVPGAGGRGRIMTSSPYTGPQVDISGANNLMAGDRARKIQREWNRKELRNMGNSPEETGEYGPMNPDTRTYDNNVRAKEEPMIPMKSRPARKIDQKKSNVTPQRVTSRGTGKASSVDMDEAWKDYMRNKETKEYGGQYKEGGTYYLSGGQIAKLRALGYDVQEH